MSGAEIAGWIPLVMLVATLPVFAVLSRGRPLDEDVARRGASGLLGYQLRDWLVWVVSPLERLLVRARVSPDALNFAGLGLGLVTGVAFILGALPLAAWLLALSGICDVLDGRIARAQGVESPYGAFLDSTLDRFAEVFTFVGVVWFLSDPPWMAGVASAALGGSMLVSYARARGEAAGVSFSGGLAQRAERIVILAVAALADSTVTRWLNLAAGTLLAVAVAVIAVGALATALHRTVHIARALADARDDSPDPHDIRSATGARGSATADRA